MANEAPEPIDEVDYFTAALFNRNTQSPLPRPEDIFEEIPLDAFGNQRESDFTFEFDEAHFDFFV